MRLNSNYQIGYLTRRWSRLRISVTNLVGYKSDRTCSLLQIQPTDSTILASSETRVFNSLVGSEAFFVLRCNYQHQVGRTNNSTGLSKRSADMRSRVMQRLCSASSRTGLAWRPSVTELEQWHPWQMGGWWDPNVLYKSQLNVNVDYRLHGTGCWQRDMTREFFTLPHGHVSCEHQAISNWHEMHKHSKFWNSVRPTMWKEVLQRWRLNERLGPVTSLIWLGSVSSSWCIGNDLT